MFLIRCFEHFDCLPIWDPILSTPAFSYFYIGGSVEISNLTYTNDLMNPKSHAFILQAEALQNYVSLVMEDIK